MNVGGRMKFERLIPGPPPINDNFADAVLITGESGSYGPETIDDATVEVDEQQSSNGQLNQTVWFKWIAPTDGTVSFDTHGSLATDDNGGGPIPPPGPTYDGDSLDTTIGIWTGTTLADLVEVDSNDDDFLSGDDWGLNSRVDVTVTEDTTYWIQVTTYSTPVTGTVILNWNYV